MQITQIKDYNEYQDLPIFHQDNNIIIGKTNENTILIFPKLSCKVILDKDFIHKLDLIPYSKFYSYCLEYINKYYLSWIEQAINMAYDTGFQDGQLDKETELINDI